MELRLIRRPMPFFIAPMMFNSYFNNGMMKMCDILSLGIMWPLKKLITNKKNEFYC